MQASFDVITTAISQLVVQLINVIPKLIITLIIWWVGKYLIRLTVKLIKKIDIKGTKIDDKIIGVFSSIVLVVGKILLVLIILDYWNIGKSIISAVATGLTLTFAIALGLAFGRALEADAKKLVEQTKKHLGVKN